MRLTHPAQAKPSAWPSRLKTHWSFNPTAPSYLEVQNDLYEEARDALARFAELEKSPEYLHTYRITPLSLWNAAAAGLGAAEITQSLEQYSKYDLPGNVRAWHHHTALTAATTWFVAEVQLNWRERYARDPEVLHQLEVEVLPALSTANVRDLVQAVLPVPHLTPQQAREMLATHLLQRARSTASRLRTQRNLLDLS